MLIPDYGKCSLLLPFIGADNGILFPDWSSFNKSAIVSGNSKTVLSGFKYYDSCGYFDGAGDYLSFSDIFNFRLNDFTIACWISILTNTTTYPYLLASSPYNSGSGFYCMVNGPATGGGGTGTLSFIGSSTQVNKTGVTSTSIIRNAGWKHLAICRHLETTYLFIDGILEAFHVAAGVADYTETNLARIGVDSGANNSAEKFYMQDLFVLNGTCLWTADFTPPSPLIKSVSGILTNEFKNPVERTVLAVPRSNPSRVFGGTSDVSTGAYSISVPDTEVSVIALHSGTPSMNDLIKRVIPG